ncbi:unnamed protein product [Blepharisma stoltei]|uniref:SUMO-activating enzyme subunit n=1 Tax=Blepharisma stoltei TaxID=1481888 RepID=A0AAU9KES8_9CILI|nr:unnamed protein product [Blepharisma stoltei]
MNKKFVNKMINLAYNSKMEHAKILVVGAGGIGCELLKTLVMVGIDNITVIDIDTIDKSNLNRQFLFRPEHVGRPKAEVAVSTLKELRPSLNVTGIQANITNYGNDFFQNFAIVLNALDNLEARRYVNRLCVSTKIPMIDAGTQGKLGQVTVHVPHITACYECEPKPTPKTYPVCTIRSTPSKPIHCIVWAKYLYEALFGLRDPDNILSDLQKKAEGFSDLGKELFNLLFKEELPEEAKKIEISIENIVGSQINEDKIGSLQEYAAGFIYAVENLKSREPKPFDKDDQLAIQFVGAASNLRAANFKIEQLNLFKTKEIAGNIIPAVATTNAMAAGLQVIEALKILRNKNEPKNVWISEHASDSKIIVSGNMPPPMPKCYTCSVGSVKVKLNFNTFTLGDLVSKILKNELSMQNPTLNLENGSILYESGEGLDEEDEERYAKNYKMTLNELKLADGVRVSCDNFSTDFTIKLIISHDENQELYEIVGEIVENEENHKENGENQNELKRKSDNSDERECKKLKIVEDIEN